MMMRVSIIVPCRNERRYIGACLDSIVATHYPHDRLELIIVDGRSDDGTREIVQQYVRRYAWMRLLDNPSRIVPTAMNRGILAAGGDIIARMDAHVIYPPDYLPRLVAALASSDADNVGGRLITLSASNRPVARAIAAALAHPLGVGNAQFRLDSRTPREVDTVPFGCYRREVFSRIGLFDEELVRNQDDEFNHRLLRQGGRILLVPDVVAYYYARDSLAHLARMYYQYGYYKPRVSYKVGTVMTVRQLVPAAFAVTLVALAALAVIWPPAGLAALAIAGIYTASVLACSIAQLRKLGLRSAAALACAFPVLHGSYGFGFLRGVQHLVLGRRPPPAAAVPLSR